MKRDDGLIRALLMEIEAAPAARGPTAAFLADRLGRDPVETFEHLRLLIGAGWVRAIDASSQTTRDMLDIRLTMTGHDFLAAVRRDTVWRRVLDIAAPLGGVPLEVLKDLALAAIRRETGSE